MFKGMSMAGVLRISEDVETLGAPLHQTYGSPTNPTATALARLSSPSSNPNPNPSPNPSPGMDLSKHGGSAYEFQYGGLEGPWLTLEPQSLS